MSRKHETPERGFLGAFDKESIYSVIINERASEVNTMSTRKDTVEFILNKLGDKRFSVRAMFGEYALYADKKVVALICNDQLYVKILPESAELEDICDKDEAYPGSKKFYVVEESQLSQIPHLSEILLNIAKVLLVPQKKIKKIAG